MTQPKDPYEISGGFATHSETLTVWLQTNNPTTQPGDGQLFRQTLPVHGNEPFNVRLAKLLRNLANSVEYQWEQLDSNSQAQ